MKLCSDGNWEGHEFTRARLASQTDGGFQPLRFALFPRVFPALGLPINASPQVAQDTLISVLL
jgi:hypothetical protein